MQKYDAVVVGAGNAGLAAAINMRLKGKRVLLVEQHNVPGGCATGFVRGRFEIEPSLHELCGVGPENDPGDVRKMMDDFGIDMKWCEVPDCFRVITTDSYGQPLDVTMPSGRQAFIDKMAYYVPGSRKSMEDLFALCDEIAYGLSLISNIDASPKGISQLAKNILSGCRNMLHTGGYPTKDVLDALNVPLKAQDILSTYWSYLGVDLEHLNFIHYSSMINTYITKGAFIPMHTSHEISNAMLERFRELGGDIWFNCRAEKFLFDGDVLCGVKTSAGEVKCDMAFANINPDIIYGQMVDQRVIPEHNKKLSNAINKNYSARMFTFYCCLDCLPEELGIKDYSIFLSSCADSAEEYRRLLHLDTNEYCIFLCYNVANPEFSPEGTCVCSFTTFHSAEDWNDVKPEDYVKMKNEIANKMLANFEKKTGINIRDHIEEFVTASPLTFARYLNVPEGSVYGYEQTGWDGIISRSITMAADYSIKGLYPIGTSSVRGDGYSSAYYSGKIISDFAMKKGSEA